MIMEKVCDYSICTGCFACLAVCPYKAIEKYTNDEGFEYPVINSEKCIHCHLCENTCPSLKPLVKNTSGDVYVAWANDKSIREQSSSGGIFSVLAMRILSEGGIVIGASLEKDNYVRHVIVCNNDEMPLVRGSKYVQSLISIDVYLIIKKSINEGRKVLFSGTPCQVAGIRKFIKKGTDYLYTVDFVCHGVPSPEFFALYLEGLKNKYPGLLSFQFRNYKCWWDCPNFNIDLKVNGKIKNVPLYDEDSFYADAFRKGLLLRENCYTCEYASVSRVSDITLGDFWGIEKFLLNKNVLEAGCSMVSINTDRGNTLFELIKDSVYREKRSVDETIRGGNEQLVKSSSKPLGRNIFYKDAFSMSIVELVDKYNINLKKKPRLLQKIKLIICKVMKKYN